MLTKRIIPCLDIKDGRTVKGVNFKNLRDAGDPVELAEKYANEKADELVFLDISATEQKRKTLYKLVLDVAASLDIPFTVGGGIKSIKDVYNSKVNLISFSNNFLNIENDTKNFLRFKMYNNKKVLIKNNKGKKVLNYLFKKISTNPSLYFSIKKNKSSIFRQISDYISGMTDRFALNLYNKIK